MLALKAVSYLKLQSRLMVSYSVLQIRVPLLKIGNRKSLRTLQILINPLR